MNIGTNEAADKVPKAWVDSLYKICDIEGLDASEFTSWASTCSPTEWRQSMARLLGRTLLDAGCLSAEAYLLMIEYARGDVTIQDLDKLIKEPALTVETAHSLVILRNALVDYGWDLKHVMLWDYEGLPPGLQLVAAVWSLDVMAGGSPPTLASTISQSYVAAQSPVSETEPEPEVTSTWLTKLRNLFNTGNK